MDDSKLTAKGWAIQSLAEFLGTAMFLYLGVGGAEAVSRSVSSGSAGGIVGQALAYGLALMVTVWAFFRISGSQFNPAITLSSLITGHISVPKAILYMIAQFLGALVGVGLVWGTSPFAPSHQVNELLSLRGPSPLSPGTGSGNGTSTGPGSGSGIGEGQGSAVVIEESIARAFFLEFLLTAILCFVYHMTVHEKNRSTFMAALPYGMTLFSCHLFATGYTKAGLNPAKALAVSVVAREFSEDHWIFWAGPIGGAILAAAFHILFRFLDYDHINPGIDAENMAQYARAQEAVLEYRNAQSAASRSRPNASRTPSAIATTPATEPILPR